MDSSEELKHLLEQIAETAYEASNYASQLDFDSSPEVLDVSRDNDSMVCIPPVIASSRLGEAIEVAANANPNNLPNVSSVKKSHGDEQVIDLWLLSQHTGRFWAPDRTELTVNFLDQVNFRQSSQIIGHLNSWSNFCDIEFRLTRGIGEVRVAFAPSGNWAYTGTDSRLVPVHQPTLNFGVLLTNPTDAELRTVVEHQAGHILGIPHRPLSQEQRARVNESMLFSYMQRKYGMSRQSIERDVLGGTRKSGAKLQPSLMDWQFPCSISNDRRPILGMSKITNLDVDLIRDRYFVGNHSAR